MEACKHYTLLAGFGFGVSVRFYKLKKNNKYISYKKTKTRTSFKQILFAV